MNIIRMVIAVPLENLNATVKFFDKNKIVIRTTEFTQANGDRKKHKFLDEGERNAIASIKNRSRGEATLVAERFGVTANVIRRIWNA